MTLAFSPHLPDAALPVRITLPADVPPGEAVQSIREQRDDVLDALHSTGALLLRDFPVQDAETFREVCAAISPNLRDYTGGDSPRSSVTDKVYTSTEYANQLEVLLHNELSYAGWSPDQVFFGCLLVSSTGGETHLADGRRVYRELDTKVRERFERKGVTYLQHLWDADGPPGVGKSWQETFEAETRADAERYLKQSNMQYQWTELGLRTAATKPAARVHTVSGETCWHNQVDQWHRDMGSVKESFSGNEAAAGEFDVSSTAGTESLGNHAVYGDGSEIDTADLYHIREVSRRCEIVFPWQRGDIMVLDNVLTMHGRKPFTGKRKVVVAMA